MLEILTLLSPLAVLFLVTFVMWIEFVENCCKEFIKGFRETYRDNGCRFSAHQQTEARMGTGSMSGHG